MHEIMHTCTHNVSLVSIIRQGMMVKDLCVPTEGMYITKTSKFVVVFLNYILLCIRSSSLDIKDMQEDLCCHLFSIKIM